MSVLQRNAYTDPGTFNGRPTGPIVAAPPDLQRAAVIDQLAPPTAGAPGALPRPGVPTTGGASPFARGGTVKQLPSNGTAGKLADVGVGVGSQVAGQLIKGAASNAARKGVESVASQVGGRAASLGASAANLGTGMGISIGTDLLANKLRTKEDAPTFGGEFGNYTDDLGRRFQGTGGGIASNAVKYAGYGANPALVGATGGLSIAAGAAAGAIKGAIQKHAKSAYTDFKVEDAANAIKAEYEKELGRPASDAEVEGHLVGVGWDPKGGDRWVGEKSLTGPTGIMQQIRTSPEAQAFKATGVPATARGAIVDQLGTAPAADASKAAQGVPTVPGSAPAPPLASNALAGRGGVPGSAPAPPASPDGSPAAPPATPDGGGGAGVGDTSGWNTDGYAAPAHVAATPSAAPPGWDADKWNDSTHQTPKYGAGRILSQYPPTVEGLTAAAKEIEQAYPGSTFNGKDTLSIPGVGDIDVLKGAGKGGEAWQWMPKGEGGDAAAPTAAKGAPSGVTGDVGGDGGDLLARLQAEIDRIQKGEPDRNALMAQMGAA
jgi:hypothetical protein